MHASDLDELGNMLRAAAAAALDAPAVYAKIALAEQELLRVLENLPDPPERHGPVEPIDMRASPLSGSLAWKPLNIGASKRYVRQTGDGWEQSDALDGPWTRITDGGAS